MKPSILCCAMTIFAIVAGGVSAASEDAVRHRLMRAIDETRALAETAREWDNAKDVWPILFDDRSDLVPRRFPVRADVKRHDDQRPWIRQYLLLLAHPHVPAWTGDQPWPREEDAPFLRTFLGDPDPALRGLAAEALATLHDPADVPRIALLLDDQAESAPVLGWNRIVTSMINPHETGGDGDDGLDIERSWQPRRVNAYARAALKLMTARDLNAQNFAAWWERNTGGRDRIWFWQQRLHFELAKVQASEHAIAYPLSERPRDWFEIYHRQAEAGFARIRRAVAEELENEPAEVEAKVRLLALNNFTSSLGCSLGEPLMGRFECRRISPGRLLDLLERKDLWPEVDWDSDEMYNSLVVSIVGEADRFFSRADVPRLRAIRRQESAVYWNGNAAFLVGISRLLPAADPENLDQPDTRDGELRDGLRRSTDLFVRAAVARELTRVGLPQNWPFLESQFFSETDQRGSPDVRTAILQELGAPPLISEKRRALATLLLDDRYDPLWLKRNERMGDDQCRIYAIQAVNAHAGSELLTWRDEQDLTQAAQPGDRLLEVKAKVKQALEAP